MYFDCIVIGAGLAGITAAREVQQSGKSVLLLEANEQVGGRVRSDVIDGFICDRGFQVINPRYPQVSRSKVLRDLDFKSISGKIRLFDQKINVGYSVSTFSPKLGSINQKLKFLKFVASPKIKNEKSFGYYINEFPDLYHNVLEPFLSGVFLIKSIDTPSETTDELRIIETTARSDDFFAADLIFTSDNLWLNNVSCENEINGNSNKAIKKGLINYLS